MNGEILVTRAGPVATVLLSNPAKLNALTVAMWRDLASEMRQLSDDDGLRCVVLRGAGTAAFAAGADIAEFASLRNTVEQGKVYHHELVHGALRAVGECRHPTVAMIHGACAGGGLELACQCDLRIAGESARFGVPINRLGFAIAYDELAAVLPLVGRAVALEILVEGRVWNADEALAKGLLTRLVTDAELAAETGATVQRIIAGAPLVARWHKQFIRRLTPKPAPLSEAEIQANFDYFNTEDYRIGYDAFMSKKTPRFVGR
ncbi:MAG: enoyl-CoA hydratase-related protein [Betaproteobacteria bacterium]|jgi:enoyl-CoA hydratase/carnithine racemase|nr:enoyl-CoA hydratase-related protein [Betaproteobacteria bacterium]MDH5343131.1 enoyl-CoA hydratase-related protein [Betaproteobacteria bacterium]